VIAARSVASTSSTQNEISIPAGCLHTNRREIDAIARNQRSIDEGERRVARLQRDEDALRINLAPGEPEYALVERRRLLDVLHVSKGPRKPAS
jgi:hypothetical protein